MSDREYTLITPKDIDGHIRAGGVGFATSLADRIQEQFEAHCSEQSDGWGHLATGEEQMSGHTFEREEGDDSGRWVSMEYLGHEVTTWDEHEEKSDREPGTDAERLCQVELRKWLSEEKPEPHTDDELERIFYASHDGRLGGLRAVAEAVRERTAEIEASK